MALNYIDTLLGIGKILQDGSELQRADTLDLRTGLRAAYDPVTERIRLGIGGACYFPGVLSAEAVLTGALPSGWSWTTSGDIILGVGAATATDGVTFGTALTQLLLSNVAGYKGVLQTVTSGSPSYTLTGFTRLSTWPYSDPVGAAGQRYWPEGRLVNIVNRASAYYGHAFRAAATGVSNNIDEGQFEIIPFGATLGYQPAVPRVSLIVPTTNATLAILDVVKIPPGQADCIIRILGRQTSGGTSKYVKIIRATLWNDGTTVTELGAHITDATTDGRVFIYKDISGWTSDYSFSGQQMTITATGAASTNINWKTTSLISAEPLP